MTRLTTLCSRVRTWVVWKGPSVITDGPFFRLPVAARVYVACVVSVGAFLFLHNVPTHFQRPWLTFGLLVVSVAMANFKVPLPMVLSRATMSLGHMPDFISLLLVGPDVAMVLGAISGWYQCTFRKEAAQPFHRTLFSMASIVITIQAVAYVFEYMGGGSHDRSFTTTLQTLSLAAVAYFLVNTMLVAAAVALATNNGIRSVWHRDFFWTAPGYFLSAAAAGAISLALQFGQIWTIPIAALPLYLTYKTYSLYLRRLEDQQRHAQELATLHNAALEALERATTSERALAAEKAQLALEKERLSVTVANIGDGVVTTDVTGCVMVMNQAAERLLGRSAEGPDSLNVLDVFEHLDMQPKPNFREAMDGVLRGESVRLAERATLMCVDGEKRIDAIGHPMRDRAGDVVGTVFVLRDITDAAQLEQERARATQLASLGVLAGGLAHDFNNLLTGIVGNISIARFNDSPEEVADRLQEAESACQRARKITNQLLTFSNGGAPVKTTTWIGDLVKETSEFALRGSRLAPRFVIPLDLSPVDVDLGQIGQVLHNLVLNAQQATPAGGVVNVTLANEAIAAEEWRCGTCIRPGHYVSVAVKDHGVGISPENLKRIFDPYFTTKKTGNGLGLAVCYSIVSAHDGYLTVASEVGAGTCFTMYLPAATRRPAVKAATSKQERLSAGGRVLIMDDEPTIRDVATRMFKKLGYQPMTAADGEEAIALVRAAFDDKRPFDIVVMDLTVPGGMGGKDALPLIREIDPSIKAIVSSGYADDPVIANHEHYGFNGVMCKPYVLADMRSTLGALTAATEHAPCAVAV
jgi:PAS domain S-box-containing protein